MLGLGLLPILAFGLLALMPMLDTSPEDEDTPLDETPDPVEDDETAEDEMPDDEMEVDGEDGADPVDPTTLGATFEETDDGITVEFGENETGSLAVFTYVDTEDSEDDFLATHEARYYLVPEGVEWADNRSETSANIPGTDVGVEAFEEFFDLTLLGTVDLLAQGNDSPTTRDMADALPDLTTNAEEVDYYYLEANTDGDDLITFLQEGWVETRNGVPETVVTEDTVGTDEIEWFSTATEGVTLDGGAGDDTLDALAADVTVIGGDGGDSITATVGDANIFGGDGADDIFAANATIDAGAGDDSVRALDSEITLGGGNDTLDLSGGGDSTGFGEAGEDRLSTVSSGSTTLYGGAGDDRLSAVRAGNGQIAAELYGSEGNDSFGVGNGAQAFGGDGNDFFQVSAGGIADGGTGDDTLRVWDFYDNEGPMVVTGGDGSDTFDIGIRNAFGEASDPVFAVITDFNATEDVLIVDRINSGPEVDRIAVMEDPDGAFTDVEVFFGPSDSFPDGTSTVVRLTGVTGLSADTVVIGRP